MTKLLITDATIRARKLGFIARENANKTRLWFYRGDENKKSGWKPIGTINVNNATVLLADFNHVVRK